MLSPRARSLSDSMDYDDELAELHDNRERQLKQMAGMYRATVVNTPPSISDEDTEDASEDGESRSPQPHSSTSKEPKLKIKEQLYLDKLGLLKINLEELEAGNHIDYNRKLEMINVVLAAKKQLNEAWNDHERARIERDYSKETLLIGREFEDKKIELRESLISELEEKRKQIEMERYSLELTSDLIDIKPMSTRKLRRRPNEPVPIPEKRRKTPQSQVTFLLDEKLINDDLMAVTNKKKASEFLSQAAYSSASSASEHSDFPSENQAPTLADTRIEDGKLFYEKRWFHRGQPVFVEGKDLPRTSGVISGISQDLVWVRKLADSSKLRVPLSALQKAKMFIKRRA